jgi:hypothetical protein
MEVQEPDADVDVALEELKRRLQGSKALYMRTCQHRAPTQVTGLC